MTPSDILIWGGFIVYTMFLLGILPIGDSDSNKSGMLSSMTSSGDKRVYGTAAAYSNTGAAADRLAKSNEFMVNFMRIMKEKYITRGGGNEQTRSFYTRMLKNYNVDNIFENIPPVRGVDTSFVTDKGVEFGICLREQDTPRGEFIDFNTLQFVLLHELTHLGCIGYGHEDEFWNNFGIAVNDAVASGMHTAVDYAKMPTNYCGLNLTHNPYFK